MSRTARTTFALFWLIAAMAGAAVAEMPAGLVEGRGVEIEGDLDSAGVFVASDVELLLKPRSLKLRGRLRAVGEDYLELLGWRLAVTRKTEFSGSGTASMLPRLVGEWVEVTVRERSGGVWLARRVETEDVKPSVKIKGTAERVLPPDGFYIGGRLVRVAEATGFATEEDDLLKLLFDDLKSEDDVADGNYTIRLGDSAFLSGSVREDVREESGYSLDNKERTGTTEPSLRLESLVTLRPNLKFFTQANLSASYLYQREPATEGVSNDVQGELRQFYVAHQDVAGRRLGYRVGKQRLRDEREFLFDDYVDAARLYLYQARPFVLEGTFVAPVVPLKERIKTWTDLLVQVHAIATDHDHASVFAMRRWDSDARNREPVYFGVAAHSRLGGDWHVWTIASLLRGEDKDRPQRGYAVDLGLGRRFDLPLSPWLWAGYARGSGDDPDTQNSEGFRQTGYQDNSSRLWGHSNFQHFGEVLDPELANIEVVSVGAGMLPFRRVSFDAIWHGYSQHRVIDEFDRSDLRVVEKPLDGDTANLGWALDVAVGIREVFESLHLTYRLGYFRPGAAFLGDPSRALGQRLQVRWEF